jgi:ProQ/FINO family
MNMTQGAHAAGSNTGADIEGRGASARLLKVSFQDLAEGLIAAGLALPTPLQWALRGDVRPLAIGAHEAWAAWAAEHGYDAAQTATLLVALGKLARSGAYRNALADDQSARYGVDGQATGRVSEFDRHSAALLIHARALREPFLPAPKGLREPRGAAPPPGGAPTTANAASAPLAAKTTLTMPTTHTAPVKPPIVRVRPTTLRLGGLSPEEIERRKRVLAAANR